MQRSKKHYILFFIGPVIRYWDSAHTCEPFVQARYGISPAPDKVRQIAYLMV